MKAHSIPFFRLEVMIARLVRGKKVSHVIMPNLWKQEVATQKAKMKKKTISLVLLGAQPIYIDLGVFTINLG